MTRSFRPRDRERGSAMVETTIIMPAYCIAILGLIFFGNVLLGRQKQRSAVWYVGLSGYDDAAQLGDIFCTDVEGEFEVSTESGLNEDEPFEIEDLSKAFEDMSTKHVHGTPSLGPGGLEMQYTEVDDYSSSFMEKLGADLAKYCDAVQDVINRDSQNRLWMVRTRADVAYTYEPDFANLIFASRDERLSNANYLRLEAPETDLELPTWESKFSMVIRHDGEREGPQNMGGGADNPVTGEDLLNQALDFLGRSGFPVSATARGNVRVFEDAGKIRPYWKPGGPDDPSAPPPP